MEYQFRVAAINKEKMTLFSNIVVYPGKPNFSTSEIAKKYDYSHACTGIDHSWNGNSDCKRKFNVKDSLIFCRTNTHQSTESDFYCSRQNNTKRSLFRYSCWIWFKSIHRLEWDCPFNYRIQYTIGYKNKRQWYSSSFSTTVYRCLFKEKFQFYASESCKCYKTVTYFF